MSHLQSEARPAGQRARRRAETRREEFSWWAEARDSFRSPAGMVAVLVIAVQAIWRGTTVAGGFFTQDDFLMLARATDEPMGWDHLTAAHSGEFSPIGNLLVWATTQVTGFSWGGVTFVVLLLQTLAALLTWVVLTQVLEDRWVKIPLLVVACFTPLTLGATLWWSLASTHLPTVVLLLVGFSTLLAHLRSSWRAGLPIAGVALVLVLLCSDRSLALPLVAFVVVAAMWPQESAGVRERLIGTATSYARLWLVLLVALVVRVLVGVGRDNSGFGWPQSFADVRHIAEQYVRQGISGLVGGPWTGTMSGTALEPDARWPLAVAAFVCLLLAAPIIRSLRDPVVAVAGVGLVLHFVLGAVVLILTKDGLSAMGMVSRFVADVAPSVVVLVALALRRTVVPDQVRRFVVPWPGLAASVLAVALLVSCAVTARAMVPTLKNEDDRAYVDYVREGLLIDPRIVLLDGPVPEGIMSSLFGSSARVSTVVGLLPEEPTFGMPSEVLRMVDGAGILREVDLTLTVPSAPAPEGDCGYAVTGQRTTIPMSGPVAAGNHVLEISYLTGGDTYAEVQAGEETIRIPIRSGVHTIQVPVRTAFSNVTLTLENPGQTVCVGGLSAGVPTPAPLITSP
ncbi:hypothetical protein IEQ44_00735 [Nocardioides sp. Y6]|uniref:Uncharacterized protein n=1 Tax=Nocardioides malaquae TaxID=2773426 RepID=A0ABR9RNN8_9ACTN|nr:hypothetical protein [Nocardioides malaquae]MBE7323176.1 hypothetical protein [Nocardioides malaquae]